jgi:hypothetical protein
MPRLGRTHAFVGLVAFCAAGALVYLLVASRAPQLAPAATPIGMGKASSSSANTAPATATTAAARRFLAAAGVEHSRLLFRDLDRGDTAHWGRIAVESLTSAQPRRLVGSEQCERVYFEAGRGLCLAKGGGFGTLFSAEVMDAQFHVLHKIPLSGIPSRARVSRDGRYGATTTFVAGHSYASPGKFSTATLLLDLARGKVITNLERFTVTRDGKVIDRPDMNFWGVTFTKDSNLFYATMATGHKTYLIEGNIAKRTAHTLHENVECPSLSPDGTRIAYKKLVQLAPGTPRIWHLHVLDLRTMRDIALAETGAIDDQAEWLGNKLVVYGSGESIRAVHADGTGQAMTIVPAGDSPAVLS